MKIHKVINNNVISVLTEQNKEMVVMGRGIAFKKKPGEPVDEQLIEKIFKLENKDLSEHFKKLLEEIPLQYMDISDEVIRYAKEVLGKKLNESIYVSLTDHIHFAVYRQKNGMEIKNPLLWEVKRLYKDEFSVGKYALDIIEKNTGIRLPEDEAGFITLHIVNSELNEDMTNIVNITKVMQEILNIVKYHFHIEYDEESLNYYRFVTHLKFFAQRIFSKTYLNNEDDFLFNTIKEKYKEAAACTEKIKDFVLKKYEYELTTEEKLYLTIHIARVMNRN